MPLMVRVLAAVVLLFPSAASAQQAPAQGGGPVQGAGGRGRAPQPLLPFIIVRHDPALDSLIAPDAKLETIITIPGLSGEGPMWRDGRLWFSDQRGGNIYSVSLDGQATVVAKEAGGPADPNSRMARGPNGEATARDGSVLVCRKGLRDIGRLNDDGSISSFIPDLDGKKFNSPNDLVFGPDGTLWFTDPPYGMPGPEGNPGDKTLPPNPARQLPYNGVFRYRDGKVTPVITDMSRPNGIALSSDGRTLYVADSQPDPIIRAYDVASDGSLSNQRIFIDFSRTESAGLDGLPDGLKLDSEGNVWATAPGGINIVSRQGKLLGRIQLPAPASNIAFGEDLHSVFFTSASSIYRMRTIVAGQKPMYYRE